MVQVQEGEQKIHIMVNNTLIPIAEQRLLYFIVIIVILSFVWEQILSFLNRKKMSPNVPGELAGIYDEVQYVRQQAYQQANSRFSVLSESISFVIVLSMLLFGGFGYLDELIRRQVTENSFLLPLIYIGILTLAMQIISLPFAWYDTFVIEEKFGFNKSTKKLFIADALKQFMLTVIIGGIILSAILFVYEHTGKWFWVLAWIIITLFSVLMSMFYSKWIVPFFNKQRKLHSGELRQKIETFAWSAGFEYQDIYIMDGSKRTTKANAYFTGLGRRKRIVLYDTLLKELNEDEILAVLAHEIGHFKKKHILKSLIISIITSGITLFVLSLFLDNPVLSMALKSNVPSFHLGLIGFSFLFTPIMELMGLVTNFISRKNEYEADASAKKYNLQEALISGLKKNASKSLANLNPHPWYVFCYYSHPTLLDRIKKLTTNL